jgi:alpha-glucosidase
MKIFIFIMLSILSGLEGFEQQASVVFPNRKIGVALFNQQESETGEWYLKVNYSNNGNISEVFRG